MYGQHTTCIKINSNGLLCSFDFKIEFIRLYVKCWKTAALSESDWALEYTP